MRKPSRWARFSALILFGLAAVCPRSQSFQRAAPDYSKEGFVVEQMSDDVVFSSDGTGQEVRTGRVRVQTDTAIQQFGVLKPMPFPKRATEFIFVQRTRIRIAALRFCFRRTPALIDSTTVTS